MLLVWIMRTIVSIEIGDKLDLELVLLFTHLDQRLSFFGHLLSYLILSYESNSYYIHTHKVSAIRHISAIAKWRHGHWIRSPSIQNYICIWFHFQVVAAALLCVAGRLQIAFASWLFHARCCCGRSSQKITSLHRSQCCVYGSQSRGRSWSEWVGWKIFVFSF